MSCPVRYLRHDVFVCRWRVKVCLRPWGSWTCCLTTLRHTWHLNDTETCELCSNTKPLHHCVPFRGIKGLLVCIQRGIFINVNVFISQLLSLFKDPSFYDFVLGTIVVCECYCVIHLNLSENVIFIVFNMCHVCIFGIY